MIERHISTPDTAGSLWGAAPTPLVATPQLPACDVCVVIPVRDEQNTLAATLAALANQVDLHGLALNPATYEIIVLANNCRDDSAAIARHFAGRHAELALHVVELDLPAAQAHVGAARRLLMDEAWSRFTTLGKTRGIIATTDGDTLVSPTWIAATRAETGRGADAVGGRIMVDPLELRLLSAAGRECHLRDVGYRSMIAELESRLDPDIHDPWPRHFQHFGASLAVTAEAYLRAGRLPVKPWFEDVAFYDALTRADARFRHSPAVQVRTSGRRTGRTGFGFAVQLTQWESMDPCAQRMCVESARAAEARITARRKLRQAWRMCHREGSLSAGMCHSLADQLNVDPNWLKETLNQQSTFGMLMEQVKHSQRESGRWHAEWPLVDIREAIWDLRCRLEVLRTQSPSARLLKEIDPVEVSTLSAQMS
ncbi:MAG: glycosyltransferase [Chloroflexia bacterium]|nr:glycosyltransferase [Chloroflexia bacterium]